MKILILCANIPFPVNTGNRIRTLRYFQSLHRDHQLGYICFPNATDSDEALSQLKEYCQSVWVVDNRGRHRSRSRLQLAGDMLRGIPWELSLKFSPEFERQFVSICNSFDIIIARYLVMAQYILRNRHLIQSRVIIDFDDLEFIKARRTNEQEPSLGWYDAWRKRFNTSLLEGYHRRFRWVDATIVCSAHDRDLLNRKNLLANVNVVPNAVELEKYRSVGAFGEQIWQKQTLLFCGTLNYAPNLEGIIWFLQEVFPLILRRLPGATVHIVGMSRKKEILEFVNGTSIRADLNVPSVLPYYNNCSAVIVPLHVGGGTRIKILESFACRRPVISTTVGAEGLGIIPGTHCVIADTAELFAQSCITILSEYTRAESLTVAGHSFVAEHYDAPIIDQTLRSLVDRVASGK